jgi:hypothetical protein
MTSKLASKVALVTGGSAGIGLGMRSVSRMKAPGYLLPAAISPNWIRLSPRSATAPRGSKPIALTSANSIVYSHPLSGYLGDREQLQQSGLL